MYTQLELMVVILDRPFLGLEQPDALLALSIEVPGLHSPLLNGSLQGINSLSSGIDVLGETLVTQS